MTPTLSPLVREGRGMKQATPPSPPSIHAAVFPNTSRISLPRRPSTHVCIGPQPGGVRRRPTDLPDLRRRDPSYDPDPRDRDPYAHDVFIRRERCARGPLRLRCPPHRPGPKEGLPSTRLRIPSVHNLGSPRGGCEPTDSVKCESIE